MPKTRTACLHTILYAIAPTVVFIGCAVNASLIIAAGLGAGLVALLLDKPATQTAPTEPNNHER